MNREGSCRNVHSMSVQVTVHQANDGAQQALIVTRGQRSEVDFWHGRLEAKSWIYDTRTFGALASKPEQFA